MPATEAEKNLPRIVTSEMKICFVSVWDSIHRYQAGFRSRSFFTQYKIFINVYPTRTQRQQQHGNILNIRKHPDFYNIVFYLFLHHYKPLNQTTTSAYFAVPRIVLQTDDCDWSLLWLYHTFVLLATSCVIWGTCALSTQHSRPREGWTDSEYAQAVPRERSFHVPRE